MRFFGNDSDGFTLTDLISLIIVLSTITLIFIGVFSPVYLDRIKLALGYLKIPFWTVLAFYFGAGIFLKTFPIAKKVKAYMKNKQ
jgi:hypothetical protein